MPPREFRVDVNLGADGVATLSWERQSVDAHTLARAISLAADDALLGREVRRIAVEIPASDRPARIALHRAGFRLEGRLRQLMRTPTGEFVDVLVYARLASDVVYGPVGFTSVMDSVLPTKRVIGHALFTDAAGRVLLLETNYKSDWELPGGVVEPGESPRIGAEREIHEELGLGVHLRQPALVDWMPPYLGWSDAVEFIYDAGALDEATIAAIELDRRELKTLHWVAPGDVGAHVTELSARRIAAILAGRTGYTEAGHFPA